MSIGDLFRSKMFYICLGVVVLLASSVLGVLAVKGNSRQLTSAFWISSATFMLLSSAALFKWVAPWMSIVPVLPTAILAYIYLCSKRTNR